MNVQSDKYNIKKNNNDDDEEEEENDIIMMLIINKLTVSFSSLDVWILSSWPMYTSTLKEWLLQVLKST